MKRKNVAAIAVIALAIVLVSTLLYMANNAYPKVVGVDPKTGLRLIQIQYCSDVCPEFTRTFVVLENVTTAEKCTEIGGQGGRDIAWHGYIGCRPKENETSPSEVAG